MEGDSFRIQKIITPKQLIHSVINPMALCANEFSCMLWAVPKGDWKSARND